MKLVRVTCDLCKGRGEQVAATHPGVPISLHKKAVRTLDLCDADYEALIAPVAAALEQYGAGAGRKRSPGRDSNKHRTGPFQCKVRGCGGVLKHDGTLWQHVKLRHNLTLEQYRAKYGDPVPLTPEEAAAIVVKARCKVKGCGQVYSTETGHRFPQSALDAHMRGHHLVGSQEGTR